MHSCRAQLGWHRARNMLTHGKLLSHRIRLSLMSAACLLRIPSISTQAFLFSSTPSRPSTARATPQALGRIIMGKQSAIPSPSRRANSCRPSLSTDRRALSPSARPRELPRPRVPRLSLSSSSSSSESPSEHASPATATAETAAPATAPTGNQSSVQAAKAAAEGAPVAAGGQGFGAKPAAKPAGQEQKQQQQQQQQHRRPKQQRQPQPKAPPRGDNLLVVGLGNPGEKFKMTRHNAGFLVAEELARRHGGTFKIKSAFQGEYCSVRVGDKSVGILRPITYMNNSGMAVRKVMDFFKLPTNAAIALVDEVALDFGQLRLKGKGGAGGHNGLKSLQAHLKTPEYTRLRIGVGASNTEMLSDHVLGEFSRTEKRELDSVIADACDAVEHWVEEEDMAKVMTRFNSAR